MPVWLASFLSAIALLAIAVFAYASLIERNWFRIRRVSLRVLPGESAAIRVLHISDLHLRKNQRLKRRWLAKLAELKPDLVINTGDNLGGFGAVPQLQSALQSLAGTPGGFVNGSNDYEAPEFRNPLAYFSGPSKPGTASPLETHDLEEALGRLGWHNLNNRSVRVDLAGQQIELMGVNDPHIGKSDFAKLKTRQNTETLDSTDSKPALRIGVAHAPYLEVLSEFAKLGASLVFAGHTHGGQVCLPGGRALVTNCDLPPKYARGVSGWQFDEQALVLHVCAGLGTSVLAPFRLFCPPEVALVELLPVT